METNNYYICHHGIKGQKWGVRRYQNADGTLTTEGKARYKKLGIDETYAPHIQTKARVGAAAGAVAGAAGSVATIAVKDALSGIGQDLMSAAKKNRWMVEGAAATMNAGMHAIGRSLANIGSTPIADFFGNLAWDAVDAVGDAVVGWTPFKVVSVAYDIGRQVLPALLSGGVGAMAVGKLTQFREERKAAKETLQARKR